MSDYRRLIVNAGWNALGTLLPLAAAIIVVPILLERMGSYRFGLLTISWALIGYFSLFDLGLGRALTKAVAEHNSPEKKHEIPSLCSSGVAMVLALGIIGSIAIFVVKGSSGGWFDRQPAEIREELSGALTYIAVGIPLVVIVAAFHGIMEGFQRFDLVNSIRIPSGLLSYIAPLTTAYYSPRLDYAVAALLVGRVITGVAFAVAASRLVEIAPRLVQRRWIKPMLNFGGWLTVSNVVGPIIVYVDRFIIGALLSPSVVAYYTVPSEIGTKLLLLPSAVSGALFPALSVAQGRDLLAARKLRRQAILLTLYVVLPAAVVGSLVAGPALQMWLGPEFRLNSTTVMQLLFLGVVFNAIAQVPFASLQGYGRTRLTAMLHLCELPPYLLLLVYLTREYGLVGVAAAWALRAFLDMAAMAYLVWKLERSEFGLHKEIRA